MSKIQKKAAFFFGSGISLRTYPGNIAGVHGITDALFKEKWHANSNGTKFFSGPNPKGEPPDKITPAVIAFLKKVHRRAQTYLPLLPQRTKPYKPHYEDLFSLADQALRLGTEAVPNLAAVDFVQNLRSDTLPICQSYRGPGSGKDRFLVLAELACNFIHWAVDDILRNRAVSREGFEIIAATAKSGKMPRYLHSKP